MLRGAAARLGVVLLAAGCLTASGAYREFELTPTGATPAPLSMNADEADVLNAVAWQMVNELGLVLPDHVKGSVYVNEATYVQGLMRAGTHADLAWEMGRVSGAAAARDGIHVRGDVLARMALSARAGLYAHELAHVAQLHMAGGNRSAVIWIREGHADWVKYQVLARLGLDAYESAHATVYRKVIGAPTPVEYFPSLRDLERGPAFTDARTRLGSAATYGQSFLAVHWLVERFGAERLHDYLRRVDRERGAWRAVFPVSYRQFVDEFRDRLQKMR